MLHGWEILTDWAIMNTRARRWIATMVEAAPAKAMPTPTYVGRHRCLMMYGPGAPTRLHLVSKHLERGGRVAMWDMGYFDRDASMRLAIDTLHPTAAQLAATPASRRRGDHCVMRDDANPDGPIVLVGLGPKSVYAYGLLRHHAWETAKAKELAKRFPGRDIIWRPKGGKPDPLLGLRMDYSTPIADLLRGCSLVVCRHSNVAVDACIAGVPVECEGGAAYALYRGNPTPTREQRADFLARLTWWEWSRPEAAAAWNWIDRVVQ